MEEDKGDRRVGMTHPSTGFSCSGTTSGTEFECERGLDVAGLPTKNGDTVTLYSRCF